MKTTHLFLTLVFLAMICGTNSLAVTHSRAGEPTSSEAADPTPDAKILSKAIRSAAERAAPGLVTVYALRGPRMTNPWRQREAVKSQQRLTGAGIHHPVSATNFSTDEQGSGIIVDHEGYILTCSHVVAGANAVFIRTADGRKFFASEIHCDPVSDLALIRIQNAGELSQAVLGDSDRLDVGQWVVSLASPFDLERSVSAGIVSSTKRHVPDSPHPLIQNDAATNPGSSGGALLNLNGEVVGIIVGGFNLGAEFRGIGLATPINTAKEVVKQLRSKGYVGRVDIGIQTQHLTNEMAKLLESTLDAGLYVKDVQRNSPAGRAGLRIGDIITALDGKPIQPSFDPTLNTGSALGKQYHVSLVRDHKAIELDLKIGQSRPMAVAIPEPEMPPAGSLDLPDSAHGLTLSQLSPVLVSELELPTETQGVLITHVAFNSDAYREGIAAGMVVTRVNDKPIVSVNDYQNVTSELPPYQPVLLLLQSNLDKHLVMLPKKHQHQSGNE